jgi:hypothetical protein
MKKTCLIALVLELGIVATFLAAPTSAIAGVPIGDRFVIHNDGSVPEVSPAVAYNSQRQEYLVVWYNDRAGCDDIQAQRVSRTGVLLSDFYVAAGCSDERRYPDVAYNSQDNEYLVVWEHWWGTQVVISGQRVSATGQLLGNEFHIADTYDYYYSEPRVGYASTSDRYLVVFGYDWVGSRGIQALEYHWDGSNNVLGSTFDIVPTTATDAPDQPDLAYNRSRNEFLVVWRQMPSGGDYDVYGRRVKMAGGAGTLGAAFPIATSADDEVTPAVAAVPTVPNEGQYLVAWERDSGINRDIRARTVAGDGTLGSARALANTGWSEHSPAVAGCESSHQFLATWVWIPVVTPPAMMQVQGRALALDGVPLDGTTTVGGGQVFEVAVASGPVGDFLVAFDDNEVIGTSNRGIYGWLWGNRIYIPLVLRNY